MIVFLALVASVLAQSCDTCTNPLASLGDVIEVCGSDTLRTYRAYDFNLVALGDSANNGGNIFSDLSGDVEGRLLAFGDLTLDGGYSVGDKIVNYPGSAPYEQKAFSVVVGGDVQWKSGQINPVSNDSSHRQEVGVYWGTDTSAPYLPLEECDGLGPLDISAFRTALQTLSTTIAGQTGNVDVVPSPDGSVVELVGDSASSCQYRVNIDADDWNAHHGFATSNYNFAANVIVNFNCAGMSGNTLWFQGGEFPGLAENILYNLGPSCDGVSIIANSIHGSILAPWSDLAQEDGRIWGNVFVQNVRQFLQINVIDCPPNPDSCDCCDLCT